MFRIFLGDEEADKVETRISNPKWIPLTLLKLCLYMNSSRVLARQRFLFSFLLLFLDAIHPETCFQDSLLVSLYIHVYLYLGISIRVSTSNKKI